jgi:hypothetical protein
MATTHEQFVHERRTPFSILFSQSPIPNRQFPIPNRQSKIQNPKSKIQNPKSGAALVVAIAVLTLLLAIALTFFTVSRLELKTVTNIENTVRAEFLADAALNIGISFLSQDTRDHPTVTSLDHAWRTYFNGAWIQGKLWAFPDQWATWPPEPLGSRYNGIDDDGDGVVDDKPGLEMLDVPTIFFAEEEGPSGSIAGGGGIGHVYYPRYETGRNANNRPSNSGVAGYSLAGNPFLIDPEGQRDYDGTLSDPFPLGSPIPAAYQVNRWADIDNDGDGQRDSMWIPLVADTLVGDTVDGETGDVLFRVPDNRRTDSDLDEGMPLAYCGIDSQLSAEEQQRQYNARVGVAETTETAVFLYYGGDDGLDNDNINTANPTVDDTAEDRWFLTAPICSFDTANNFYLTLRGVYVPGMGAVDINTDPLLGWPNRWVDVLDNDYDLVHNKHFEYYTPVSGPVQQLDYSDPNYVNNPLYIQYMAQINDAKALLEQRRLAGQALPIQVLTNLPAPYDPPNDFDQRRGVGVPEISPRYLGSLATTWRVKSTGEPVSEIVGRAAILINDEASKVNVNIAGGHTLDLAAVIAGGAATAVDAGTNPDYWMPATASAQSTSQYCTRVLPQIGVTLSRRLWNLRMGAPNGLETDPEYVMDAMTPGYGLVDDNANALQLAMNGIDDNGNGMIDEGVNPAYPEYLGLFEGVDEPDEFQRLNPYRDLVAEGKIPMSDGSTSDTADNDGNDAVNERGEFGDKVLRTREEVKRAADMDLIVQRSSLVKPFITLHSTDKNNRFVGAIVHVERDANGNPIIDVNGRQLANPLLPPDPIREQADSNLRPSGLKVDYNYAPAASIGRAFVDDWGLTSPATTQFQNAPDPTVRFATGLQQEGVNVFLEPPVIDPLDGEPFRSPIFFRGEDKRTIRDSYGNPIPYPADPQLRALQLATNIVDGRDADYARTTETMTVKDTWWEGESGGQQRNITYTIAGCEGIRITEMMIRPVRRVEAEMMKFLTAYPDSAADAPAYPEYYCSNILSQYVSLTTLRRGDGTLDPGEYLDFDMERDQAQDFVPSRVGYSVSFDNSFRRWRRDSQLLPYVGRAGGVIGPDSVLTTTDATIPLSVTSEDPDQYPVYDPIPQWPNIIQFRFGPGPGLPPGKYYLTINTTTIDPVTGLPVVTVNDQAADQIRFAVKYASNSGSTVNMPLRSDGIPMSVDGQGQDILLDVRDAYAVALGDAHLLDDFYSDTRFSQPSPSPRAPIVGYKGYGSFDPTGATPAQLQDAATGWVFLPPFLLPPDPASVPERDYPGNPYGLTPNGIDDDGDGAIDDGPLDLLGNPNPWAWPEPVGLRTNGVDDDGDGYIDDGRYAGYGEDEGFTVTILPYASNAADQVYLYVAVCPGQDFDPTLSLAINFFDFSQEPDHEWVEIENVTGHPVDISGWTLTVGGVDKEGNINQTSDQVVMQIQRDRSLILESRPPNNRVILAVDVMENQGGSNILMNNGMGLVGMDMRPVLGPDLSGVSSPKPSTFNAWAWPELDYPGNSNNYVPNGRDDDGDGFIDDGPLYPDGVTPNPWAHPESNTTNGIDDDGDGFVDESATSPGVSPFDDMEAARRIVQVTVEGLTTSGAVTSVNDVAKWVLRGGVFPDYPEQDGVDNDNDNTVLAFDHTDNIGDLPITFAPGLLPTLDKTNEGVDEGGYRELTKFYMTNPGPLGGGIWAPIASPGSFNYNRVRSTLEVLRDPINGLYQYFDYNNPNDASTWRDYLGYSDQPPEWKDLVERRLFPGDNVVVTLFEGSPDQKRVVDRVTYNERDVINRSTDDDVSVWYWIFDGMTWVYKPLRHTLYDAGVFDLDTAGNLEDATINRYVTFWPDNTMMLDFYRTLERKYHPLYNGDRFGTSNRWEATDGNYDDWSHFPVAFSSPNFNGTPLARNAAAIPLPDPSPAPTVFNMNPEEADLIYLGRAPIENFDGDQAEARVYGVPPAEGTWTGGSSWSLLQGAYVGSGGTPTTTVYRNVPGSGRWKDHRFACDFKPLAAPNPANYEIGFRVRSGAGVNQPHYIVSVANVAGQTFYRISNSTSGMLAERPGPPLRFYSEITDGQAPLTVDVEVEGRHISAIINGVVFEATDNTASYHEAGTVGLYCSGVQVAFDNVYVITPDRERNRPYTSTGDAATQPYLALDRTFLYNTDTGEFSTSHRGIVNAGTPAEQRWGDWIVPARDVVSGVGEKPVEFPRGLRLGDSYPLDVSAVVSTAATDRVLLTCGQADFTLLWPVSDTANLLKWNTTTTPWLPPQVWRPVFSYSLGETTFNYIYQISGLADADLPRLGNVDPYNFLFNNTLAGASLPWLRPDTLLSRYGWNESGWRKDPRVVMYVSGNLNGFVPDSQVSIDYRNGTGEPVSAEALFEWNAEDGLENGQYDVYLDVGAYTSRFSDADRELVDYALYPGGVPDDVGLLTTLGRLLYVSNTAPGISASPALLEAEGARAEDLSLDIALFTDENGDGQCWTGISPTWQNLDAGDNALGGIRGFGPGAGTSIPPDGYLHCGSVRVKSNYLALYLRNWSPFGTPNRFLGLILTPRDRTSGRININTVETRPYRDNPRTGPTRLFNALMGVPGVLFDEGQQYIAPDGAPTPPRLEDLGLIEPVEGSPPQVPPVMRVDFGAEPANLFDRARFIEVGRPGTRPKAVYPQVYTPDLPLGAVDYPHRQDGRYYASLSELLSPESEFWATGADTLHPLTAEAPLLDMTSGRPFPDNAQWNDEIGTRFGKMANLITTRSDVFEILVTVQAGYAVDANGDGQINWRSNDEFIVTAEKKARSVYER